ncbi:MAG TPA: MarR family transcriptional regulator [Propionibacteriaceae bacterium]|nr:MarR family transcriptional regulator [Propionibacteriaceae bacterium]
MPAIDQGLEPTDYLTLDQQLCFALAVASRTIISMYRPLLEPLGLTHPQYLVMVALWQSESLSVSEISQLLQLEPPSVSPVLKRLQSAGLIERQRDTADERTVRLTLTEQGRTLREQAVSVPLAIVERIGMSISDLEDLRVSLHQLINRAQKAVQEQSSVKE